MTREGGGKPRSIRKRGFWRAYRRKELWAIASYQMEQGLKQIQNQFDKVLYDTRVPSDTLYLIYPMENRILPIIYGKPKK